MLHTMILAGGGGTRFWPRSRQKRPKQFLTLTGDRSLLQQAFDRAEALAPPERTWVVTAEAYRAETQTQLPMLSADRIVGEPVGRDTAAAIGLGAALIAREDRDAVMLVTPADHVIEPSQEFRRAVQVAEQLALENAEALVTFGIVPTYPAIGYGYIQRGKPFGQRLGLNISLVQEFKEKPHADLAERYFASGQYFWNSGIFVWRAATVLAALRERLPALHAALLRVAEAWDTPQRDALLRAEYPGMEKTSIDYAVMEHASAESGGNALVVQAPFQWDDVGSWRALERLHPQDAEQNTVLGTHAGIRTHDCVIVADSGKLIATIGVDNLLIVQDGDAILVADRRDEATVKELVALLRSKGLENYL
jgi:mannose-1-phosphate guanylyltransferase